LILRPKGRIEAFLPAFDERIPASPVNSAGYSLAWIAAPIILTILPKIDQSPQN
jgi:hypothetical protein